VARLGEFVRMSLLTVRVRCSFRERPRYFARNRDRQAAGGTETFPCDKRVRFQIPASTPSPFPIVNPLPGTSFAPGTFVAVIGMPFVSITTIMRLRPVTRSATENDHGPVGTLAGDVGSFRC
jgi:hypothetical protein